MLGRASGRLSSTGCSEGRWVVGRMSEWQKSDEHSTEHRVVKRTLKCQEGQEGSDWSGGRRVTKRATGRSRRSAEEGSEQISRASERRRASHIRIPYP